MKRRLLSLVLAVGCSLAVSGAAVASEYIMPDYVIVDGISVPKEMILQQDAVNAYQILCDSFEIDDKGNYIYPDDYAGAYIDDEFNLVVLLTEDDTANYTDVLSKAGCIEYKTVEYSINELNGFLEQELANLPYTTASSISYYIENKTNTAVIEVSGVGNESQVYGNVRRSVSSPVRYDFVNVENELQTTLYGGDKLSRIPNSSYDGNFTAGICGTYKGNAAILTCGHISADVGDPIYYGSTATQIGTLAFKNYHNGSYGDYGIITLNDNGTMSNMIKHENGKIAIRATMSSIAEGTYCYKYGQKTGTTYLQVTVPYYDLEYNVISEDGASHISYTINDLVKATIIEGWSDVGDSGGPYYLFSGGRWVFCGTHTGYGQDKTDYTSYCYFSPYRHASSRFTVNLA